MKPDAARACAWRIQTRLRAQGEWRPEYQAGVDAIATECASYLDLAQDLKRLGPKGMKELARAVERTRIGVRKLMADFRVIPREWVRVSVLNADGLDADIVAICAPPTLQELRRAGT